MKIVTLTAPGPQTDLEADYIYEYILKGIRDLDDNRRIVVYSSNRRNVYPKDLRNDDILVHLSNENLRYNYAFTQRQNIIFRSYYHPLIWRRNCYTIPLGWSSGMQNYLNQKGDHAVYKWAFIGQIKGARSTMWEVLRNSGPNYVTFNKQWNSKDLSQDELQAIYLNSAFAPCPFGSIHADTLRIMEALEFGCIPVCVKFLRSDYYKLIFGDHPFIVGDSWQDASNKMDSIWRDKELLESKLQETQRWYIQFKSTLAEDIRTIISTKGTGALKGRQFHYQKINRFNPKLLSIWLYHFYIKHKELY